MKKLTFTTLALCQSLLLAAGPIGRQAALYTAQSYLLAKGKTVNMAQKPFKANSPLGSSQAEEGESAYYYVFNVGDDGGYVIVSGDDRINPILGYVDKGTFDLNDIPDNMRDMLDSYEEEIKYVIDNDLQPTSPQLMRRSKVIAAKHSIPELLSVRWNQGLPYNLTLPYYYKSDGSQARPATGCIATAWAQIVAFHRYPDKIQVAIPSYSKTFTLDDGTKATVRYSAIARGTPIDWDNVRDTYSCSEDHSHTAQDTAVADLMRYCGYAVKMSYGAASSASYRLTNFIKYFGFDDGAYRISRDNYDIDGWVDAIYDELEKGYPIPVSGIKIGGGHAFVIDGFDGDDLFHVNWGWGGQGNGYFLLGILNRWNRSNGAIINLRRPDGIKAEPKESLSIDDVSINGTSIKATFTNKSGDQYSFHGGVVKAEEDGTFTPVGARLTFLNMDDDASQTKSIQINGMLSEGTYKLSPASKLTSSSTWQPKYNMRDEYIEAVVNAEGTLTMRIVIPHYDIGIDAITFPRLPVAKEEQEIDVTFDNRGDEFYRDVFLFASQTESKVYTDFLTRVAAHKGEKVTFPFYFTPEEPGTYNIWLCTGKDGSGEIGRGTLAILTDEEAVAERSSLAITHSIVNGSGTTAYAKRLVGKATIQNTGTKTFRGGVELELWHQKKGSNSAVSGPSRTYKNLEIPVGKTATIDYEFNNLSEDYYYRIKAQYTTQSGNLSGGGLWDYRCEVQGGYLTWKSDGTVTGKAQAASVRPNPSICGFFADCSSNFTSFTPNNNPNTIYALAAGMDIPESLAAANVVSGKHASRINLYSDQPYYVPVSFTADSASFTYTFPETETGTGWHAFTLPFRADSIFVDDVNVTLNDTPAHFLIYEFAAQGTDGEVIFAPATVLRAETPYIIAADETMAGRSIIFRSLGVPFFQTGTDKMVVTTPDYQFHGITHAPRAKDCYLLNDEGTAFEYITTNKTLPALTSYFTTSLSEEERQQSITLASPVFGDDGTPVLAPLPDGGSDGTVYDLQGRRVGEGRRENGMLPKGIYIMDGKKVLK